MRRRGWPWFALWALAGALTTIGLLGGFGVGVVALIPAAAALLFLTSSSRLWPEGLGLSAGIAVFVLYMGVGSGTYPPCPEGPIVIHHTPGDPPFRCGGADPTPFYVAGTGLLSVSVAAYGVLKQHPAGA